MLPPSSYQITESIAAQHTTTRYIMDPPRRTGLSLQTQARSSRMTEPTISTAPASPTERTADPLQSKAPHRETTQTVTTSTMAPPYSTLGHLSFAPATQQTVVTTTTTTTVSLPPLLFRPPQDLSARDPKQYPLAFSPTPDSLRRFTVEVGGKPVVYREAEDAQTSLTKVCQHSRRDNTGIFADISLPIVPTTAVTATRCRRYSYTRKELSSGPRRTEEPRPPFDAQAASITSKPCRSCRAC